ncbi:MAG: GNAT family N-acetyltransferase [Firmicutes bacterium]|nr:GNAT family N-acetyltransferase [Bacillota bacterium]
MIHKGTKELESNRLLLCRVKEGDALEIFNGFVNQESFLYYANKEKRTLEEEVNSLKGIDSKYLNDDYYNWVIKLKDTNQIIGSINLKVEDINETVEFNYVIDERFWNKGYMSEALNLVKDYCLNELCVNRFQGGCCIENIASKRVMEKCNMQCEGILRNYIILSDGYHDMYMFSIINNK